MSPIRKYLDIQRYDAKLLVGDMWVYKIYEQKYILYMYKYIICMYVVD